jgi:hypothetical protein
MAPFYPLIPPPRYVQLWYLYQIAELFLQRGLSVIRVSDRNVGSGTARTFPVDALAINCAGKVAHTAGRHVLFYHLSSHQCLF